MALPSTLLFLKGKKFPFTFWDILKFLVNITLYSSYNSKEGITLRLVNFGKNMKYVCYKPEGREFDS
jgi:hypothetical protein